MSDNEKKRYRLKDVKNVKDFRYWLTNIYWYHYKWPTLAAVFALVVTTTLLVDLFSKVNPDVELMMVTDAGYLYDQVTELETVGNQAVLDANGDGKRAFYLNVIDLTEGEMQYISFTKITALATDEKIVLYMMDESSYEQFKDQEMFEKLSALGLADLGMDEYRIRADEWPIFKRSGINDYVKENLYFLFRVIPEGKENNPKTMAYYDAAKAVLMALKDAE